MSKKETEVRKQGYAELLSGIIAVLEQGRQSAARSVNAVLTATYWLVGQRLVEHEQHGAERAAYGSELLKRLSHDLQSRLGRGFSERNLDQMRQFYLQWGKPQPTDPAKACTTFKTVWNKIRADAGVKGRWHDNRHTLIAELAESGAGDQTIQDIAGHVSRQMLKHYSHIRMDAKRKALESIVAKKPDAKSRR